MVQCRVPNNCNGSNAIAGCVRHQVFFPQFKVFVGTRRAHRPGVTVAGIEELCGKYILEWLDLFTWFGGREKGDGSDIRMSQSWAPRGHPRNSTH